MGTIQIGSDGRSTVRTWSAMLGRATRAPRRAGVALWHWYARAHERRALMELDERLLRDIGVTRADAEHEASKPFWRP